MLTQARLKELLEYNPDTGEFRWKIRKRGIIRCVAGNLDGSRPRIGIDNKTYYASRLAWLYMTGSLPEVMVDHKDTDVTNNRWDNLRLADKKQNGHNRGCNKNNTSGYKGVTLHPTNKNWSAEIMVAGKRYRKHGFHTAEDAFAEYQRLAQELHGEFARV